MACSGSLGRGHKQKGKSHGVGKEEPTLPLSQAPPARDTGRLPEVLKELSAAARPPSGTEHSGDGFHRLLRFPNRPPTPTPPPDSETKRGLSTCWEKPASPERPEPTHSLVVKFITPDTEHGHGEGRPKRDTVRTCLEAPDQRRNPLRPQERAAVCKGQSAPAARRAAAKDEPVSGAAEPAACPTGAR